MFYFKTSTELAELINQIEQLPEADLTEKKQYALRRVAAYYNWERIAEAYRALIDRLIREHKKSMS